MIPLTTVSPSSTMTRGSPRASGSGARAPSGGGCVVIAPEKQTRPRAPGADTAKAAAQGIGGRRLHECREVAQAGFSGRYGDQYQPLACQKFQAPTGLP
ncbi:hypothetical protein GCM10010508_00190 [Streptomyces naganishii JCM 4654]|uniref:Uncharacterized protein n=1 Tax=Streptomyces naganishii JCM 4654 TaxID=1306179 RepID=A0A918XY04_9ACTN|nr:hypothetical protein GCM10010508_00190 [Streptomyces naganishii JCM 4654]